MKFTDGHWLIRDGVKVRYAAQAYDVIADPDGEALTVTAPTKPIGHRGDTLDGPVLTVRYSSPMPDVIRVSISHYQGEQDRPPHFEIHQDDTEGVQVSEDTLTSGRLSVRIGRGDEWSVEFLGDGRTLTKSGWRALGYAQVEGEGAYVHEQLGLGVGEHVYGLGERFTSFTKNGQVVDIWNKDGGTCSEQAYKNVPFYMTNRGYGVFVNHPGAVSFEVASERVTRVQFSVPGESLEYMVIYGPTPREVLQKYTALTGRPALPPAWSFGLWLTTSFTTNYDEETVTRFIQGMADRDVPLHVFHFDCFWMREFNWCDFVWDSRTFPDPPAMLKRLKARGLHVCVWINPYIAQRSPLFAEGKANGYLLKKPNGDVWQTDRWQAGMAIVDFTNPEAKRWFGDKLRALVDMGVDCFKTDFGECIPIDVAWHDGSDPERMHNFYTLLYNQTVFEVLKEKRGEGEAVLFARSATTGGQQYPVHWGGDCFSTFESMAESLRGGLSLCASGFGFWSHDIGGFEGTPPPEVYKRWVAFGLLSSHSRLHGSESYRVPWAFDDEAVDVLRFFTKLKCRLMPYLYTKAVEAHETGMPVMRAMAIEFPDDPACEAIDRQYMLGESLLVAPVMSAEGEVSFYLPEGQWTSLLTGEALQGPRWFRQKHGFMSLPLFVRENTLLAMGANDARPDYDYADGLALRLYALQDGATAVATVPSTAGETVLTAQAARYGSRVKLISPKPVFLVGVNEVANLEGGTAGETPEGLLITPEAETVEFNLL